MTTYLFRIFLSYSHEDKAVAQMASEALSALGYAPLWEKNIKPGTAFTEAIKGFIHYAHLSFSNIENSNEEIYTASGLKPGASRHAAIQHIQEILSE